MINSAKHTPDIYELDLAGEKFLVVDQWSLDPDYRTDPKTQHFCALCQKDMKTPPGESQYLHFVDGGSAILAVADEDRYQALSAKQPGGQFAGEMGCYPVGPECARKLPKGYVLPPRTAIAKATGETP